MFIDSAKIYVRGGKGGKGCESYYRDKYTRNGIPDGGEGGRGGDILIQADRNLSTLLDLKYNQHFFAKNGGHGSGNTKKGKDSPSITIRVPCGTIIKDNKTGCVLRDLKTDQESIIVACGGEGGLGNKHNRLATDGQPGEERELLLDLSLIADVGIIGFPNVGKSTLITHISNAHSQVAAYPFTTKFPVLGVVKAGDGVFTIADIPGLIEGSSQGKGLGDKFLRHVQRTKLLVHLIDVSGLEGRDPVEDYKKINLELKNYSKDVQEKQQIIAANKIDLEGAKENLTRLRKAIKKKIYPISALKKEGLEELIEAIRKKL
ncbi:MAG: GTPase ObgE [Candidatus Omnitrophica bacterium]|nr:GTPase ObgE [Candidatus Omnitrophota bacterium]